MAKRTTKPSCSGSSGPPAEFWFDQEAADRAVEFFPTFLKHGKGEWAGQPFHLSEWEETRVVRPLFGWKRRDGARKYRTAYIEIPRKNGKSTKSAGLALRLLLGDGEPGAEIYSAACDREQAAIVFEAARRMVEANRILSRMCKCYKRSIYVPATQSVYKVLSADAYTKHGFNAHGVIFDELHAQPNRELWDVLMTATGARRQPLIIAITTAGYDRNSICWEQHDYAIKVRDGIIDDPAFLPVIYAADPEDDWTDERTWEKANPSLDVTVSREYLRREAAKAREMPAYENAFKRLHLNIWTEQATRWMNMETWDACAGSVLDKRRPTGTMEEVIVSPYLARLKEKPCYAGLDLSTTTDISALVLVFPESADQETSDDAGNHATANASEESARVTSQYRCPYDGNLVEDDRCLYCGRRLEIRRPDPASDNISMNLVYRVVPFFWVPADTVALRERRDRVPYRTWAQQGLIEITEGNVVDYEVIRRRINELGVLFDIREIAIDRWNATQLATQLQDDGFTACFFGQGYASMSGPTKELEKLVLGRALAHGRNPVLRWMAANVAVEQDAAGNIKPSKRKSTERIDGIVALIMAIGRAAAHPVQDPNRPWITIL